MWNASGKTKSAGQVQEGRAAWMTSEFDLPRRGSLYPRAARIKRSIRMDMTAVSLRIPHPAENIIFRSVVI